MTRNSSGLVSWQVQLLVAACLLTALAYLQGLFGSFVLDDFGNIVDNPALRALDGSAFRWKALALSSNAGPLRRPLSMLSFGADYWLYGLSPLAFKSTNLIIHLINGALIYGISRRITPRLMSANEHPASDDRATYVALFVTSLWLVHPLNVSGVVYVIQRMNELASLFILLGLACYLTGRERASRGEPGLLLALAGLSCFGFLATLCKENGAIIMGYALVIEWICYGFASPRISDRIALKVFFVVTIALPIALFVAYIASHAEWLTNGYAGRDFTPMQRMLSEARVLWLYLLWIAAPIPSQLGIFHDDFAPSHDLFHPLTTAPALLAWLTLILVAWKLRRKAPGLPFAIAWFLVGHSMESSIIPLELIFEHRNYLPAAGLLLGGACSLLPLLDTRFTSRKIGVACIALILTFSALTAVRANEWKSQLSLALTEARYHPQSARAQYEAGRAIIFDGAAKGQQATAEDRATPYFERGKAMDTTDIYTASSLILIRGNRGMSNDEAITDLARRIRQVKQAQINPFLVVMTAATERRITVTPEQMDQLVSSAFDNPHFTASMRAMILNNYGHYQFQVLHNNQEAISLTIAAAEQDPANPLFQINLTKLALAVGDQDQANKHIQLAEGLNKAGLYNDAIDRLKLQIASSKH